MPIEGLNKKAKVARVVAGNPVGKRKPPQPASYNEDYDVSIDESPKKGRLAAMSLLKANPIVNCPATLLAFHQLVKNSPAIINRFKTAYEERKLIRGTSERERGAEGLTEAVASLLSAPLPTEYHTILGKQEGSAKSVDSEFSEKMHSAFEKVERQYPDVMRWFAETLETNHLSATDALAGLLTLYCDNASTNPF